MPLRNKISSLIDSLQLLQAYQRAIDENIISSITDTKGKIVYANNKFCEISKYSPAELVGQDHRITNSGHHPKIFFKTMWQTLGKGEVWHGEIKNRAKDGTHYWLDTVIVPIKDDKRINTNFLSVRTLITERKQVEEKKSRHVSALETLLVMTASKVKKPLSNCVKQLSLFDSEKPTCTKELKQIANNLKSSATELDGFTKELTTFIRDIEK